VSSGEYGIHPSAVTTVVTMAGTTNHRPRASEDYGVFDDAKTYYASDERHRNRYGSRTRTYSQVFFVIWLAQYSIRTWLTFLQNSLVKQFERNGLREPFRRGSHGMPSFPLGIMSSIY
jgi:alpha,alpha-trehalase